MGTAETDQGGGKRKKSTSARTERRLAELPPELLLNRLLDQQLDSYLAIRKDILQWRNPREEREQNFLKKTFSGLLKERNERAIDIVSDEGKEANEIAQRVIETPIYFDDCIDSRVMRTIKYGVPLLTIGGAIRRPAGDMSEFVPVEGGGLTLLDGSYFANILDGASEKHDRIVQVLDSHRQCAARNNDEREKGFKPTDDGLYQDVLRKKEMSAAMIDYVAEKHPGKKVVPIQTTFDPETGFMYMGLEKDAVLEYAKAHGGFTHEVFQHLEVTDDTEYRIIDTKSFLQDDFIRKMFRKHKIDNFDWEGNYRNTIVSFWRNFEQMVRDDGVLDYIATKVAEVYPDADSEELRDRSVLLAMNSFNAYNLNSIEGGYPHSQHKEACVVVSEGEHGPYGEFPSFSVFSKATDEYVANVGLAARIIRDNREKERVIDKTGEFMVGGHEDVHDFVAAPVPVLHKVIIRDNNIDWAAVREVVWKKDFIPDNWYQMTTDEFSDHVHKEADLPHSVFRGLDTLRKEMAVMLDPQRDTGRYVFDGQLEVIPALVDGPRTLHTIVPFIHKGYPRRSASVK